MASVMRNGLCARWYRLDLDVNTRLRVAIALLSPRARSRHQCGSGGRSQAFSRDLTAMEWMRLHGTGIAKAFGTGTYPYLQRVISPRHRFGP